MKYIHTIVQPPPASSPELSHLPRLKRRLSPLPHLQTLAPPAPSFTFENEPPAYTPWWDGPGRGGDDNRLANNKEKGTGGRGKKRFQGSTSRKLFPRGRPTPPEAGPATAPCPRTGLPSIEIRNGQMTTRPPPPPFHTEARHLPGPESLQRLTHG